jgi:protein-S-isoprenylcysteine O-methyltransferase Ste14
MGERLRGSLLKKLLTAAYGILTYALFLGAFLYAIVFVGNFFAGSALGLKTIDSGAEESLWASVLINALLLGVFAVQHSLMARPVFKQWWTKLIGTTIERTTYVLLSSLALILLYWQWRPLPGVVWSVDGAAGQYALWAVCFLGWGIVFLSTWMISHFELFGLKQIYNRLTQKEFVPSPFQASFFYKLVRHPLMVGFIIAFWATPYMSVGHLIFSLATTAYIVIAVAALEEPDLRRAIGREYEEYQEKVPMFVPFTK